MFLKQFKEDLTSAKKRLLLSGTHIANTKLGPIEYAIQGEGIPILCVHGILGGADQAVLLTHPLLKKGFRVIAVSRFGYGESPLFASSPAAQADVFAALLDHLKINKTYIIGFSEGCSSCLQFAIKHEDRCSGIVLVSPMVAPYKMPSPLFSFFAKKLITADFISWCVMKYFPSVMMKIMGIPKHVLQRISDPEKKWLNRLMLSFLPFSRRAEGMMNDLLVTNPHLNKAFPYRSLPVPCMVIHSVDDPLASFSTVKKVAEQIPRCTFVGIADGGHLQAGHEFLVV